MCILNSDSFREEIDLDDWEFFISRSKLNWAQWRSEGNIPPKATDLILKIPVEAQPIYIIWDELQ